MYLPLPIPEMPPPDLLLLSLSTAAWIAALTAALGLWRFVSRPHAPIPTPTSAPVLGPTEAAVLAAPAPAARASPATPAACHVMGALGSPRSRFTVVFNCEELPEACPVEGGEGAEEEEEESSGRTWELRGPLWTGVRGDLGWYRYQDRTAIDGSVVRLWDDLSRGLTVGERKGQAQFAGAKMGILNGL